MLAGDWNCAVTTCLMLPATWSGGTGNIHWATMQLPPELVDYVLVHELAHHHHPDHSQDFWRTVERALPDYQARRDRLRRVGPGLWLPDLLETSSTGSRAAGSVLAAGSCSADRS